MSLKSNREISFTIPTYKEMINELFHYYRQNEVHYNCSKYNQAFKLRVLVITQYFYPENFRINDLVFSLKKRGHDIEVLNGKA